MEIITMTDIMGQEIEEVRYCYSPETNEEYSIQSCHTFIKLGNNRIIDVPIFDSEEYIRLTPDNISHYQINFEKGSKINSDSALLLHNKLMKDILFCYQEDEPYDDHSSFMKLSNGFYLTERRYAPNGIPVGPIILNEVDYIREKQRIASFGIEIRSILEYRNKIF